MVLTPSQRLCLIKEISNRLASEEWNFIDVILEQFGLPRSNEWGGTKNSYSVGMTKDASDEALVDLARHAGYEIEIGNNVGIDPAFWRKGMFRLFLSHLSLHREFAAKVQEALLPYGISAFVAHNDIEPTLEWQVQIEVALTTADGLTAFLHSDFHASNWTDQEIGFAMGRGIPIFAVRLGQDPYGFIGRFQAFNGNGKSAKALAIELFDAYRKNKQTQKRMSEVLVKLFEESGSFAEAKMRIQHLEEMNTWDSSFSKRVRSAAESNTQINNSFGVPERVAGLLKKWSKPS